MGVDLGKKVESGATNVTLCTFTIQGITTGTAGISLSVGELTDDNGTPIAVTPGNSTVMVGSATPTPTPTGSPTSTPSPTPTQTTTPTISPTVSPTATPVPGSVDFSASPRSGNAPLTVSFTSQVNSSVSGYIWSFGDGTSSDLQNPFPCVCNGNLSGLSSGDLPGVGGVVLPRNPDILSLTGVDQTPTPTMTVTPTPTPTPLVANFSASPLTGVPPTLGSVH